MGIVDGKFRHNGVLMLPTRGRPENVKRFCQAYVKTGASVEVVWFFDSDDFAKFDYETLLREEYPGELNLFVGPRKPIGRIMNDFYKENLSLDFYGIIADDVVPSTEGWDRKLAEASMFGRIAYGNDGIQGAKLPTHPFIGGELVRKLGWIAYPTLSHWFVDNVWKDIIEIKGLGTYLEDVKMLHMHWVNNLATQDDTYKDVIVDLVQKDKVAFANYRMKELNDLMGRI